METLIKLFDRDIKKLKVEIESFNDEKYLWRIEGDIKNTAGNLCLHLIGNLNYFIGSVIGETGYVRNREAEFSDKDVPKAQLIKMVQETRDVVINSLQKMNPQRMAKDYPIDVFGGKMTYDYFLIHLVAHLNYHLGQINYLRRIFDK